MVSVQLQKRAQQRQSVAQMRGTNQSIRSGVIARGRLYQKEMQARKEAIKKQEDLVEQKKTEINKLIDDINAGKVKNVNQIPEEYREIINVSQENLNQIQDYYQAKRVEGAFKRVDELIDQSIRKYGSDYFVSSFRRRAGEAFASAGLDKGDGYRAYEDGIRNYQAYQERKKVLQDIKSGKVPNVKIIGNRIIDLDTNKPITPAKASAKQIAKLLEKELPKGDKLVYDKNYDIKGIESAILKQTIPYTKKGIDYYNENINKPIVAFQKLINEAKENGKSQMMPGVTKSNYNFSTPAKAANSLASIITLIVKSGRKIPMVFADFGISLGKGFTKIPLYAVDDVGYLTQIKFDRQTGKFYIPAGTKAITDNFGKVKKWANYDFKTNPLKDPDFLNATIFTALVGLGAVSPKAAAGVFGLIKGKAIYDAIQNPTEYNIAVAESLFIPELLAGGVKGLVSTLARKDILTAKSGDLVPLQERIKQVDFLVENANKEIESVTATPTRKVKLEFVKNKNSPDYTYGNKVEFATYKVGKAFPTSEYFLKGKATTIQKLLRTGAIKIEKVLVSSVNKKYGEYIKKILLSKERVSESFIKKYYSEAKAEANRLNQPVAVISPKRLRGYAQPEQELIKILPDNYVPPKTRFAGITKEGYRVFSYKPYLESFIDIIKSKFGKGRIERSYWESIARDKLEYIKGRKAIPGEYSEHGRLHLTGEELDAYAKNYAKKLGVKKFEKIFEQHDLAKVADEDSFIEFEHGQVLYDLWKKGKYPDKNIYKLDKKLQKQIMEAYAGHTPVKPRLIDTLKKGWKDNSVVKDLIWYARNRRNPYLQDVLTLDRIDLPRAGRWNFRVKYNFLDKNALKRIYGSEINAVKNIRFLDWKSVPGRLKRAIGKKGMKEILSRDREILKDLKKSGPKRTKIKKRKVEYAKTTKKKSLRAPIKKVTAKPNYQTKTYKSLKTPKQKLAYQRGYEAGERAYGKAPKNYSTKYGIRQKFYAAGYRKSYNGRYVITNYKTGSYSLKTSAQYKTKPKSYVATAPKARKATEAKKRIVLPKGFKKRKLKTKVQAYYVIKKRKGLFVRLTAKPLILSDAKDYLAYHLDQTLSRSAWYVPIGKVDEVVILPGKMKGYFAKNQKKLRPYKIRRGKRGVILNGYIERRNYAGDTKSEQRELKSARKSTPTKRKAIKRAPAKKVATKPMKKKISPQRRKQLLASLKKARAVKKKVASVPKIRTHSTGKRSKKVATKPMKKKISPQRRKQLLASLKKARAAKKKAMKKKK